MEPAVLKILAAALLLSAAVQASDARIVTNGENLNSLLSNGITRNRVVANGLVLNKLASNGVFKNKLAGNGLVLNRLAANGTRDQGLPQPGTGESAIGSGVLVAVELPR